MSQQDDDEGTVIRPRTLAPAFSPSVTSPDQMGGSNSADTTEEDGLSLRAGSRLGEFEIIRRLGAGGFSIVYLAMDRSLERTVALKEYLPSSLATRVGTTQVQPRAQRYRDTFDAGLKSFVNEAKLLAQFDHPSLVKVFRFWEANGTAYMVMPFYQGLTVKDTIRAMPEPPDEAWLMTLLAPLTEALTVIHADHCYHRDIAPDNVILLSSTDKPLLLDFGAARRVIGDMTQGLTVILKAGYAPVEQYAEIPGMKQGPWTDVYALAALVHWAILGATPPASVGRMMNDSFVPLAERAANRYSLRFLRAIDRALIVRPDQRTQSIDALRHDLGLPAASLHSLSTTSDESDALTVIRPPGYKRPAPAPSRPDLPVDPAETGQRPRTAPPDPLRTASEQYDKQTLPPREEPPRNPTARSVSVDGGAAKTVPWRIVLVASALGAASVGAAIWWALQKPATESAHPIQGGGAIAPPAAQNTGTQGAADAPEAAEPVGATQTSPASNTGTAASTSSPVETEASKSGPAVPPSPSEMAPDASPPRARNRIALPDSGTAPAEQGTKRPSRPSETGTSERIPADASNSAECARIFQRLSLGETNPELLERLKTLRCR